MVCKLNQLDNWKQFEILDIQKRLELKRKKKEKISYAQSEINTLYFVPVQLHVRTW